MDWNKLKVFHAVAQAGSFTHAGETLGLSQSAVSRQISALEASLDISLFHRHARGLRLTEQGDLLFRTSNEVFAKLAMAEARISDTRDRPTGTITVTTTVAFGTNWLTPRIREFLELYADISVVLILDDDERDLGMREADIAIGALPRHQPDLLQRRLFNLHYRVYASPDYLKRHGEPQTPEDLDQHRIIVHSAKTSAPIPHPSWLLGAGGGERAPVFSVNNAYGMYRAVESGLGIAALPDYMSEEESRLVQILPELQGPSVAFHFLYPPELKNSKRIEIFREFILRKVAEAGLT